MRLLDFGDGELGAELVSVLVALLVEPPLGRRGARLSGGGVSLQHPRHGPSLAIGVKVGLSTFSPGQGDDG